MNIEIVYPEELSLQSQISLFSSNRIIIGTTSSAFHTSIFSKTCPILIGISYRTSVPSNYNLIDKANNNHATYVFPEGGFLKFERDRAFMETFEVVNPTALASDIADLVQSKSGGNVMIMDEISSFSCKASDHQGTHYQSVLSFLHRKLAPKSYFEIGTLKGETLILSKCPSIAVDPNFQITDQNVIGNKALCCLFQMKSDDFFAKYSPKTVLGQPIDLAFLDGMHRCEFLLRDFLNTERHCKANSIIILHDCLPLESPMAERDQGHPAVLPHRNGWWTGDIWRTVIALKRYRSDLSISAFDAGPTGLVVITNLDPNSRILTEKYQEIVSEMFKLSLDEIGIEGYFDLLNVEPTSAIMSDEKLTGRFWL